MQSTLKRMKNDTSMRLSVLWKPSFCSKSQLRVFKKNEKSPNTEYLFQNMEKQDNLKKSIAQMNLVNSIDIHK